MSTGTVEFVFRLVDRVTAPARNAQKALGDITKALDLVTRATRTSGAGFGGWARQGEQAARKVEGAFERVQRRVEGMSHRFGNLQNMYWNGMMAIAPVIGAGYAGKQIVDAAAYKQDTLINLKGMLKGNQQQASKLFADAVRFADVTPFTTQEVINATSQALAIGFTQRQAIPLVSMAGKLSAGSGKPMEQVMEAFAALRVGDFGQAFGIGQGFSNLNISRDMLRKAGLKFDAQGGYQGTVKQGLDAVRKIIESTYGKSMDEKALSLSGLASTIASRPQDLFMSLVDNKGQSKALASLQHFMSNIIDLTDFGAESGPGAKIRTRFQSSMTKLFTAIFHPLAQATSGDAGVDLVNRILDRFDQFSAWWTANGPGVTANLKGFGQGLKSAYDGAMLLIRPLGWIVDKVSGLTGGSGQGGIGKVLGFLAGGFALGKVGNLLTFGGLGKLGGWGMRTAFGALRGGAENLLTRGVLGEVLTHPGGILKGIGSVLSGATRLGPPLLRLMPWLARVGGFFLGLSNPIGWVIGGVTLLAGLGTVLYNKWQPFHDFIDGIGDKFREAGRWALDIGKNLLMSFSNLWGKLPTPVRLILGTLIPGLNVAAAVGNNLSQGAAGIVPPIPNAGNRSVAAVTAVANQMGLNPADLLPVIFKESGLDPAALNKSSHAAGLMQFMPSTAKELGTSTDALLKMTPEQQVPYMVKFLQMHGVKPGMGVEQLYSAVLAGNAAYAGRTLFKRGDGKYEANSGMDFNGDGLITSAEVAQNAARKWNAVKGQFAPSITVNNYGPVTKEGITAIGDATAQVLAAQAREHGHGVAP